jgi:hypothetical protein
MVTGHDDADRLFALRLMTALERASEEEFISSWLISRSITLLFFELFMRKLGEEKEKLKTRGGESVPEQTSIRTAKRVITTNARE